MPRKNKRRTRAAGHEGKFEAGSRIVPDPLEPGKYMEAVSNIRESSIGYMASRGKLDTAQLAAAERYRALCERVAIGSMRGIDMSNPGSGGGGGKPGDSFNDGIVAAGRGLHAANQSLGKYATRILMQIVGVGHRIEDVAKAWAASGGTVSGPRAEGYVTGTVIDGINLLVELWGLEGQGKSKNTRARYRDNSGKSRIIRDNIRASGPLELSGPSHEITVGRHGDAVRTEKMPVDKRSAMDSVSVNSPIMPRRR